MTGETRRKERIGVVVSNKMQKTVVVAIETFKRHRIYKKIRGRHGASRSTMRRMSAA